jgi:UDP-N-acetylglucosamine 2-epimerase (non-hydrolysing)
MSRVIAELDRQVNHVLVHSGQNYDYELNQVFFDDLEIRKPDHFLGAAGDTAAKTIAEVIAKSDEIFELEQPDALLLYGDTNTCLAVIAAKRRKIPVFHMEAGNRCFDQRVPEELNRKVLDHLSDINMVLTEHARRYLIAEGIRPETIIKTGSHMQEVLEYYMPKIEQSDVLARSGLEQDKFFIVSAHREENVDTPDNLRDLLDTLRSLADHYGFPLIVSTHPRTRKRLEELGESLDHPLIRFVKPFGLLDYIKLQMSAFCVLSDSGTITEEASLLSLPAVTLRNAHERPEGMDEGTLIMSGLKRESVMDAVRVITSQHAREQRKVPVVADYQGGPVSLQVVRVVLSYTDYINRTVWKKA